MKTDTLDSLLANKSKLMSLLPATSHDFTGIKHLSENYHEFYMVYATLSSTLSDSKKRARNMGFVFDLDIDYLLEIYFKQQGRCKLSNKPLDFKSGTQAMKNAYKASIDRINNNQGYIKGNVRLLCHWVNNAKSTYSDKVFEDFVKASAMVLME